MSASSKVKPSKAADDFDLNTMQRWVQEVLMHPDGVEKGVDSKLAKALIDVDSEHLEQVILPSKNLTSLARMSVYANAYYWRLMDIMASDFPCVEYILGEDRFAELARIYIHKYPSTHYSLNGFGKNFSKFLGDDEESMEHRAFCVEVARLEREMEIVFDERLIEPLGVDDLLTVSPESWVEARFEFVPAFSLLAFEYPVDEFFQAWRDESQPEVPTSQKSWLAVFRKDFRIWRMRLDEVKYTILTTLKEGAPLGDALEQCLDIPEVDPDELMASMGEWFNEWTADGLFSKVVVPGTDADE